MTLSPFGLILLTFAAASPAPEQDARGLEVFSKSVRPMLIDACLRCHGGAKTKAGLDLTTRDGLLKGGDNGPAVVPGKSAESLLIRRISHADKPFMPPSGDKLPDAVVSAVAEWIDHGAPYDRPLLDKGLAVRTIGAVTAEDRKFWSFAALQEPSPPKPNEEGWCRTPVDRFIQAKLENAGLKGNPPIDRHRLIRRATFDLIGLPPSPEQIEAFVADPDPAAYDKLIDRLLANPHYGERWGRHWLDAVRYADSDGYETDRDRPNAYPYRDFVIRSLNDDLPYDKFIQWQLAGDEYLPDDPAALAATGFLTAGPNIVFTIAGEGTPLERAKNRYDELDDLLTTTGAAMLGLTIGCARCHDHKFDPIPTCDYYRMLAAFTATKRLERDLPHGAGKALTITEAAAEPQKSYLLLRGEASRQGPEVSLGFLSVLSKSDTVEIHKPAGAKTTFQRTALAEWMTDVDGGAGRLLARVLVNRLWQHHFGEGLVRTPNDFGAQGERPTHPELLDWLAGRLIADGWKLKPLHKLLMTSAVYMQDDSYDEGRAIIDVDNRLWWRRRPLRLEAEALRDTILAVSGKLDMQMFGPAVKSALPPEATAGRNKDDSVKRPQEDGRDQWRRSVYLFVKRSLPTPLLETFDAPEPNGSCGRRTESTVTTQALALLNDSFVRRQAGELARRVAASAGADSAARVKRAFALTLGRRPKDNEMDRALKFLGRAGLKDDQALTNLCQVLLTLNEFVYID